MSALTRYILLDSGPLGLASQPRNKTDPDARRAWIEGLRLRGATVVVPEIIRSEIRRQLVRIQAKAALQRLDLLQAALTLLPSTSAAIDLASELWAHVRRAGVPTASPDALDADAILAAQALALGEPGDLVTIATTNVTHLARFPGVEARAWSAIT